jgi:pilus assembly protein Flp/PilA
MGQLVSWSSRLARRLERGASLVEYALLLALIALVCVSALQFVGGSTATSLDESGSSIFVR